MSSRGRRECSHSSKKSAVNSVLHVMCRRVYTWLNTSLPQTSLSDGQISEMVTKNKDPSKTNKKALARADAETIPSLEEGAAETNPDALAPADAEMPNPPSALIRANGEEVMKKIFQRDREDPHKP